MLTLFLCFALVILLHDIVHTPTQVLLRAKSLMAIALALMLLAR